MKFYIFSLLLLLCLNLSAQQVYLGIYVMPATQIELKQANLSYGIKIDSIVPDSPAATSGLKKNDIIYKINSILIRSEIDLQRFLTHCTPDSTIEIFISQNKEFKSIIVALADRNDLHKELYIYNYIQNPWLFIGMNVEPISQGLAHLLKLETGMLILDIRENSIASFQGLEAGDIIISINDMPTVNENSLTKAMNLGLQNQPMKFYLWRNSEKFTKLVSLSNRLTNDNNQNSDEIFIVGPDIYDVELYSYSKEKINILLNKPKSELEEDIERLENEIYKLRRKIGNRQ